MSGRQEAPLVALFRAISPAGWHHDDLCALARKSLKLLREAHVITNSDADGHAIEFKSDQLIAGLDGVGFAVVESVIGVDFVVTQVHARTSNQRGAVHPVNGLAAFVHAIGRTE